MRVQRETNVRLNSGTNRSAQRQWTRRPRVAPRRRAALADRCNACPVADWAETSLSSGERPALLAHACAACRKSNAMGTLGGVHAASCRPPLGRGRRFFCRLLRLVRGNG